MTLRLYVGDELSLPSLQPDTTLDLPAAAARHAQVRRVQPGDALTLFDGSGHDWPAQVLAMGRQQVTVRLGAPQVVARELPLAVTLAVGMPANERMDTLVEKATELGVARIQPLLCERAVLRLEGERAQRRQAHWQAVAVAAAEQSGRAVVPVVAAVTTLSAWLGAAAWPADTRCLLLSPTADALPLAPTLHDALHGTRPAPSAGLAICALSGPEGGLSAAEAAAAQRAGFQPVSLGPRVLRADTAPLALLAWLGLQATGYGRTLAGPDWR
jgi:16S rRNA (uracil1498-N3)-methyltransferase